MGCNCGKPKCDGQCGYKSPAVLQINNPPEYITFHKVSIPAAMGDSTTNPPKAGAYRNALVYYEADHTSWMYSTDGIPTKLTSDYVESGETSNRPTTGMLVGQCFFDTTINKPVWYNNGKWYDATGAQA